MKRKQSLNRNVMERMLHIYIYLEHMKDKGNTLANVITRNSNRNKTWKGVRKKRKGREKRCKERKGNGEIQRKGKETRRFEIILFTAPGPRGNEKE